MTHLWTLAAIAMVYLLAVASPGPNFFLVTQLALSGQRRLGVRAVAGVALGSTIWAVLAMAGVAALLDRVPWLHALVRGGGALYLIWFGAKLLWGAWTTRAEGDAAPQVRTPVNGATAFRAGLVTNLTNPKAAAFWTSIFGSMFPAHAPAWLFGATALMVPGISGGWYLGVAWLFASARVQAGYRRARRAIDAACGALLVALGVRLATT